MAKGSPPNGMPRELGRKRRDGLEDRQPASLLLYRPRGNMDQWVSPHSLPNYSLCNSQETLILWNLSSKTRTYVNGTWPLAEGQREEAFEIQDPV